jgi:hypothetical protein
LPNSRQQDIEHPKGFEEALGWLPPGLSDLYDIILMQINRLKTHARNVAVQTLKWLLWAQRLLSISELIDAVSDEAESQKT